ncbi:MAG: DsbA family protein [Rhodospirillaceae bacterium]
MRHILVYFTVIIALTGFTAGVGAAPPDTQAALADRVMGNPDAPVTILDFSSLTCPHCADFHKETLPKLKEKFIDTGKVKLIFRDFPLDRNALHASVLARCADPKRYYGFLDVLFKSQNQWGRNADPLKSLAQIGALGGVPQADFDACMKNKELSDGLLQHMFEAQKQFNVQSTPTFVLNNGAERVDGAQSLDKFEAAIDRLLAH